MREHGEIIKIESLVVKSMDEPEISRAALCIEFAYLSFMR